MFIMVLLLWLCAHSYVLPTMDDEPRVSRVVVGKPPGVYCYKMLCLNINIVYDLWRWICSSSLSENFGFYCVKQIGIDTYNSYQSWTKRTYPEFLSYNFGHNRKIHAMRWDIAYYKRALRLSHTNHGINCPKMFSIAGDPTLMDIKTSSRRIYHFSWKACLACLN